MVVVVLLPCDQIILIHLLLHVSHVTVGSERAPSLDLVVEIALVLVPHVLCSICSVLIKHAIEEAGALRLLCVIQFLEALGLQLRPLVVLHLVEQVRLVLASKAGLILLRLLGSLGQQLLVRERLLAFSC